MISAQSMVKELNYYIHWLEENRTLLGLDLRQNHVNVNGAAAMASMLTVNTNTLPFTQ